MHVVTASTQEAITRRRTRPWGVAVVLLCGMMAIGARHLDAQGAAVSGTVRDETGRPIREALVVVDPDSLSLRARSDAEGRYRITGVPTGRFEVRVVRIGFRPHAQLIDVGGNDVAMDVELLGVPVPLDTIAVRVTRTGLYGTVATRGIALLPHAPRPLSGASVEIINGPHRTRTARDGSFSLPLGEGSHMVLVMRERFASRMVPVTIGADGGISVDIVLDSSYAAYQEWDEAQTRGIGFRMRRATNPAVFITPHELDLGTTELRTAMRFAPSLLSRGVRVWQACVFVNGKYRPEIELTDIDPNGVEGIEVYPPGTVSTLDGLTPPQIGTPCEALRALFPGVDVRLVEPAPVRSGSNPLNIVLVWTRGRR